MNERKAAVTAAVGAAYQQYLDEAPDSGWTPDCGVGWTPTAEWRARWWAWYHRGESLRVAHWRLIGCKEW